MSANESPDPDGVQPPESPEELPSIEDAHEDDMHHLAEVGEDDAELLAPSSRSLEVEDDSAKEELDGASPLPVIVERDGSGDADAIPDEATEEKTELTRSERPGIDPPLSPSRIGADLKRIEREVRSLLEARDPRRKRKLGGTRRWLELEDDLRRWRFSDRFDTGTLDRLSCLVRRRHYLFTRLRFLAGTRQVWNS